jgi:hypothetical protein
MTKLRFYITFYGIYNIAISSLLACSNGKQSTYKHRYSLYSWIDELLCKVMFFKTTCSMSKFFGFARKKNKHKKFNNSPYTIWNKTYYVHVSNVLQNRTTVKVNNLTLFCYVYYVVVVGFFNVFVRLNKQVMNYFIKKITNL